MNKKPLFFVSLVTLFLISVPLFAQDNNAWQPMYLQVSGANVMNGVEADFQLNKCGGEDVVYIKYINTNGYDVKLQWYNAVFTTDLKWVTKNGEENKKSLVLSSRNELKGTCVDNRQAVLVVKLSDFIANKENFKRFNTSELLVTPVQ